LYNLYYLYNIDIIYITLIISNVKDVGRNGCIEDKYRERVEDNRELT
jgi:hypothetical protein